MRVEGVSALGVGTLKVQSDSREVDDRLDAEGGKLFSVACRRMSSAGQTALPQGKHTYS
jgi:hypothetical protein